MSARATSHAVANRRLRAFEQSLATWAPGEALISDAILEQLKELLRAEFVGAYRPIAVERGWTLEFMCAAGEHAARDVDAYRAFVASLPPSEHFVGYDPSSVDVEQRDRALSLRQIAHLQGLKRPEHYERLFRAVGALGHDQLRVLICDEARVLSWVGATRVEPFTRGERALLQKLAAPLKRRLLLARHLGDLELRSAAFDVTLESLGRPAFVVGPGGTLELTNAPARALLARGRRGTIDSIRTGLREGSVHPEFELTPLGAPLRPGHVLAIQREALPSVGARLLLARRAWSVTARQAKVLELVVGGATNKEIATQLECAEVTVENHITELFRRSGARARADLVARLFTLPAFCH